MLLSSPLRHGATLLSGLLIAAGLTLTPGSANAAGELNVYNWGDYINPAVLDKFSQEYDVKITLDTYGSNEEMLAKIQAGATGYDIVFPSVHMHDIMQKLDLLERTDIYLSPGFENIDPAFLRSMKGLGAWMQGQGITTRSLQAELSPIRPVSRT